MKHPTMALLAILTTTPFACTEDDPQTQVEDLLDELIVELNRQEAISCDCWEQYGYESRSDCESFNIGPSQSRCMKDAYAEDIESGRLYLECYLPLEREYTACMDSRLACDDESSTDPCADDYDVGSEGCIELPTAIERDLAACSE